MNSIYLHFDWSINIFEDSARILWLRSKMSHKSLIRLEGEGITGAPVHPLVSLSLNVLLADGAWLERGGLPELWLGRLHSCLQLPTSLFVFWPLLFCHAISPGSLLTME